eukprot:Nk52_evm53s164 gene=Nk52_evmTU53s164
MTRSFAKAVEVVPPPASSEMDSVVKESAKSAPVPTAPAKEYTATTEVAATVPVEYSAAVPVKTAATEKRSREPWTNAETSLFFNGLTVSGRDFDKISSQIPTKNKEQVRHFYYRILKKIQKLLLTYEEMNWDTHFNEVYAMLCFWQLKKPSQKTNEASKHFLNDEKYSKKFCSTLHQLITQGEAQLKVSGRNRKIKLCSSIVKGVKKPNENDKEGGTSKSPKAKKGLALKSDSKAKKTTQNIGVGTGSFTIDEKFLDQFTKEEISKLKELIAVFEEKNGSRVPFRIQLELSPVTDELKRNLRKKNMDPNLTLGVKKGKSVAKVLEYIAKRWKVSSPNEIRLYPISEQPSTFERSWGMENALSMTIEGLFIECQRPETLRIAYDLEDTVGYHTMLAAKNKLAEESTRVEATTSDLVKDFGSSEKGPMALTNVPSATNVTPRKESTPQEPMNVTKKVEATDIKKKDPSANSEPSESRYNFSKDINLNPPSSKVPTFMDNESAPKLSKPFPLKFGQSNCTKKNQVTNEDSKKNTDPSWLLSNQVDISCDGFCSNFFSDSKGKAQPTIEEKKPPQQPADPTQAPNDESPFEMFDINAGQEPPKTNVGKQDEKCAFPTPMWSSQADACPKEIRSAKDSSDNLLENFMKNHGHQGFSDLNLQANTDSSTFRNILAESMPKSDRQENVRAEPVSVGNTSNVILPMLSKPAQQIGPGSRNQNEIASALHKQSIGTLGSGGTFTIGSVGSFSSGYPNQTPSSPFEKVQKNTKRKTSPLLSNSGNVMKVRKTSK